MDQPMNEAPVTNARPDWNQLAEDIHRNAVDHGWYEKPPSMASVLTNIHAELSEAWEEYRKGWPMVYYTCPVREMCVEELIQKHSCSWLNLDADGDCHNRNKKPEGIAIELADAVMRMLDTCGHEQLDIAAAMAHTPALLNSYARAFLRQENATTSFADLLAYLHEVVSCAHVECRVMADKADRNTESYFAECILLIDSYIAHNSSTTLVECIRLKHVYNLTRPYRHGGKAI